MLTVSVSVPPLYAPRLASQLAGRCHTMFTQRTSHAAMPAPSTHQVRTTQRGFREREDRESGIEREYKGQREMAPNNATPVEEPRGLNLKKKACQRLDLLEPSASGGGQVRLPRRSSSAASRQARY
eukprot:INCI5838.1.p2 GENE.INCI5838.1~~INCI5838.1.p2  ORF type:complete len:126 (+),score=1.54 INCI5838.1:105-482(+)